MMSDKLAYWLVAFIINLVAGLVAKYISNSPIIIFTTCITITFIFTMLWLYLFVKSMGVVWIYKKASPTSQTLRKILDDKDSYKFMGVSGQYIFKDCASLKTTANKGKFQFLLLNPDSSSVDMHATREGAGREVIVQNINNGLAILRDLQNQNMDIEVKLYDLPPTFRMIIVNNETAYISFYSDCTKGIDNPQVVFRKRNESSFFYPFSSLYEQIWENAISLEGWDDQRKAIRGAEERTRRIVETCEALLARKLKKGYTIRLQAGLSSFAISSEENRPEELHRHALLLREKEALKAFVRKEVDVKCIICPYWGVIDKVTPDTPNMILRFKTLIAFLQELEVYEQTESYGKCEFVVSRFGQANKFIFDDEILFTGYVTKQAPGFHLTTVSYDKSMIEVEIDAFDELFNEISNSATANIPEDQKATALRESVIEELRQRMQQLEDGLNE